MNFLVAPTASLVRTIQLSKEESKKVKASFISSYIRQVRNQYIVDLATLRSQEMNNFNSLDDFVFLLLPRDKRKRAPSESERIRLTIQL